MIYVHGQGHCLPIINTSDPISDHPLNQSLEARWSVLHSWRGGSVWRDLKGVFPLTLTGTVGNLWTADDFVKFNGTSESGSLGNVLNYGDGKWSIFGWVKVASGTTNDMIFAKKSNTSAGWYLWCNSTGKLNGRMDDGTYSVDIASSASINDGVWHHLGMVKRSTAVLAIYIDGLEVNTGTNNSVNSLNNTVEFRFGRSDHPTPGPYYLNGSINHVTLFNDALTQHQAMRLYEATKQQIDPLLRWVSIPMVSTAVAGATVPIFWSHYRSMRSA